MKSFSLDGQVVAISSILALGELLRLKFDVLDTIEPNAKPEHAFGYIFSHKLLDFYRLWFLDTCKESEKSSQEALNLIQHAIDGFQNDFFEKRLVTPS